MIFLDIIILYKEFINVYLKKKRNNMIYLIGKCYKIIKEAIVRI